MSESDLGEEDRGIFRLFTRESLNAIHTRIAEEKEKLKDNPPPKDDEFVDEPQPDPIFEAAMTLPSALANELPPELTATPLEDIDKFYQNQPTFMVISKGKDIFRFSATNAMFILSPFNPIRRVAIYILVHPLFSFFVIVTILANCVIMTMKDTNLENTEYLTMLVGDLGNLSALRTFRVLRALKTVAIVPGLKTIVGAVIESVKNLKDVIILTVFSLSVFALLGLQIYMGMLTQKCILNIDLGQQNLTSEEINVLYYKHVSNDSNWLKNGEIEYFLCGNSSGAGECPPERFCLQGYGKNPNYGYTNFDSFGFALLSAFRLMTQDFWENLYQQVLRVAGSWHMLFFIIIIFLGSYYLVNLILAIVAMSYDELQKKAQAEEDDAVQQEELLRQRFGLPPMQRDDIDGNGEVMANSPSELSSTGYDLYMEKTDEQLKQDKMSIQSEGVESPCVVEPKPRANGKFPKGSSSLPGSPFNNRRGSRGSHQLPWRPNGRRFGDKKPLVLSTFLDAQEHLPYADDSTAVTPMSEENGAIIVPFYTSIASRHNSYQSHASRISYSSHADANSRPVTKDAQLRSRRNIQTLVPEVVVDSNLDFESSLDSEDFVIKNKHPDNPFVEPSHRNNLLDMKDVMVLNDIIDQARRQSRDTDHGDEEEEEEKPKWKERCLAALSKYVDIFCLWECCECWVKFQRLLCFIVYDAFVELFITLCIVVNTLFMAMDHYGINDTMSAVLKNGNYFFTATFAIEAFFKLLAISPKRYFREGWNIFDFIIVALSLVELSLENVQGLSVLRSFRLLRVFKLAKSWPTLNLLISIMGKTVGALGNLTFVLAIIIFIFAVMGMQLFGTDYDRNKSRFPNGEMPRWNFFDFMHSFMIVFRVLCGEWIESMWDCMLVSGWPCVPFFLATVVVGNLVVLNLFLALLLSSFGAANLSQATTDNDTNKLAEAIDRISRFKAWVKKSVRQVAQNAIKAIRAKVTNQIADQTADTREMETDDTGDIVVDGQIQMSNKKSPKDQLALEVAINDMIEITIHGDAVKMKKNKEQWNNKPMCNSVKKIDDNKTKEQQINLFPKKSNKSDEDALSNNSLASIKIKKERKSGSRRSSCSSYEEEKRDASKEDLSNEDDEDEHGLDEGQEMCPQLNDDDPDKTVVLVDADVIEPKIAAKCLPECWYVRLPWCATTGTPFWDSWTNLRNNMFRLIENKYFETFIIIMILLSSLALALEDKHIDQKPVLRDILTNMDRVFTIVFFIEMLIKWIALGFQTYFTNAWCCKIDYNPPHSQLHGNISIFDTVFIIFFSTFPPQLSLINIAATLFGASDISAFRSMRTLRALRPLRAVSRWEGMKVVVNALVQAIPSIFNVLLVCLIFWLIFSIMGVQMFGGKYHHCRLEPFGTDNLPISEVNNRSDCIEKNHSWVNSKINFDNVGNAYLSLFQVATFKGWIGIMNDAIDNRGLHMQPEREANIYMYLYFVFFIIFGAFFTLNLFIGVIIDNFNEQKKKIRGSSMDLLLTEEQRKYYNAMKKMGNKKPLKAIPRPRFKLQALVFDLTTNKMFDMIIMIFIGLNMISMALDHYHQSREFEIALEYLNLIFITIFTAECGLKIFALRWHYFKEPWNMFDFIVVILSILGIALKEFIEKYFVSPTLLRVVRVVKVGRVLRLVKGAKGIRTLLFALAMSLPALFNICLLLFLVMFIYAIFGMSFFMNVKKKGGLDDTFNFETFGQSMILLFQMSTSAGWDGVLDPIMNEDDCDKGNSTVTSNCGNSMAAVMYLVSYLVISFLIVINMYIAVILENYSQATEEVQEGLTDDDYDMYYEIWQRFDPDGTQYIAFDKLSDLFDTLEAPLQIHKPNKYKIVSMDIPICKGDMCYCVDILDALTKDFFARKGNPVEEPDLQEVALKPQAEGYEKISTTLWRQREEFCARLIQKAWRRFRGKGGDHVSSATNQDAHEGNGGNSGGGGGGNGSWAAAGSDNQQQQQTAIVIENDGLVNKNGHNYKVVIHSRSPSITSRSTDV
ncbi:hypothetical protein CHUAL_000648 [Chamberlinius hualienensis]